MKKTILLGVLMLTAAVGVAQESRQDVSFSGTGLFGPRSTGRRRWWRVQPARWGC